MEKIQNYIKSGIFTNVVFRENVTLFFFSVAISGLFCVFARKDPNHSSSSFAIAFPASIKGLLQTPVSPLAPMRLLPEELAAARFPF